MYRLVCGLAAALLISGAAFAAPPKPGATKKPAPATTSPVTPKLSPADQKRVDAIQQYQHDLVNVVALRADPDYLLGAAILARPFRNQMRGLDFDSLSQRAASATGAGPAPHWARLGECKSECPNPEAFAYLKKNAADNAAVWMVALDAAARNQDAKAERAALKEAAAAQTYDDYYGKALAGVAKAVGVLPPLADTTKGAHGGQPDNPEGVRVLVAIMSTQSHIRPRFGPLEDLCGKSAADRDAGVKADCLKLAHTLQWGSSPIARAVGLHIQGELELSDRARDEQASQNLAWQVHQYSGLLQRALTDPPLASRWLTSARNGGTELSLILATLRANHVPIDAPAGAVAPPASAGSSGP